MSSLAFSFDECVVAFEEKRQRFESLVWGFCLCTSVLYLICRRCACPYDQGLFKSINGSSDVRYAKQFLLAFLLILGIGASGIVWTILMVSPRCECGAGNYASSTSSCNVCQAGVLWIRLGPCHVAVSCVGALVAVLFTVRIAQLIHKYRQLASSLSSPGHTYTAVPISSSNQGGGEGEGLRGKDADIATV